MTKRREIFVSLIALTASAVLLTSLWGYLATSTLYHKPGVGKGPYNPYRIAPDRPSPW
jgi:hypothetical protein